MNQPPLKSLQSENNLIKLQLEYFKQTSNEDLIESLKPERKGALKTRSDGTIIDGHTRIKVLRERGVEVDNLPREIWERIK